MKYTIMFLLGIITINHACNNKSIRRDKTNQTQNNDSTVIKAAEMTINSYLNMKGLVHTQHVSFSPDTIVLDCFSDGHLPKKLDIKSVIPSEEGTGHLFTETFYLGDDNGYPIIYTYQSEDGETSTQVIAKNRTAVSYISHNNNIVYINELDSFTKETKISALMFILTSNISYFDNVNFEVIQKPSLNSMPVINTLKSDIKLYSKPDTTSDQIHILRDNELLFFLDYSKLSWVTDNSKGAWFKVATSDKKNIGWVIGNANNIKFHTDGD